MNVNDFGKNNYSNIKVIRWRGSQHPTYQAITQKMQ
jgi:hypothetical protein